jgi:hypothetical protein
MEMEVAGSDTKAVPEDIAVVLKDTEAAWRGPVAVEKDIETPLHKAVEEDIETALHKVAEGDIETPLHKAVEGLFATTEPEPSPKK